jgi:hypothetical protein
MNNWMSRIAIFAVLGAILSSAVLVGCGGSDDSSGGNSAMSPSNSATSKSGSG